ncbi:MAG: DUF6512 family protein [Promethearchaeota archaeon]
MKKPILVWEIVGMLFIILLGSFLHFAFELSGEFIPLAAIAAVNESTFEHLKLGFWPALFFALIEYNFIKDSANNFLVAKFVSASLIPVSIIALFYLYSTILGTDLFILDILIFIISVIVGQIGSYKVLESDKLDSKWTKMSIAGLAILLIIFPLFTFYPPQMFIFQDPISGGYGII